MRTETAEFGRFLNHEDVENHRRVAFLGYEVARQLFSNIPPVGETIRIDGVSFEVIGVMPNKAQISNYFYPDKLSVFIPYTVNQRRADYVDNIVFQAISPSCTIGRSARYASCSRPATASIRAMIVR